ncbi:uncharacterized protein LDX57_000181 [Aspergillus melleus]|uniref:uncharacterized protein n=1 Tax=Aspergillus melleus TaxID=138277 RepID=UPI001E8CE76F|nr:uncharacterized protein LDX57_000181 [Aspergillus melleus]KAH8422427.1 hypothetical protein LDX57_000181 [Aspergillus melleus]
MTSTLKLQPVTLDDIPSLTDLFYDAFGIPENLQMFPDTPGVRKWWTEANRTWLLEKPDSRMLKVVDTRHPGRIVAYAKWNLAAHKYEPRFPPWHEESDRELCGKLFGITQEHREKVLGEREHYYLDLIITAPEYRRQGAASLLVQWGCDLADQNGVVAYLDAYEPAAPLYYKHGFENQVDPPLNLESNLPMIREPRLKY